MGMDQTTYVGPYIKIKKKNIKPIEKENTVKIMTCTNTNCEIHGKKSVGKFCSSCGSPNGLIKQVNKIQIIPDSYDLLEEFGDVDLFFSPSDRDDKEILLVPNTENDYSVHVSSDDSFLESEIASVEDALSEFTDGHKEFLDFLEGKEIVYQKLFGVLSYWY
jgi:hypothetical protein